MPGTTPVYGFPYPEPTDLVADYPALGQQLAEDIEDVLPTLGGVRPATPTSIANTGGTATLSGNTVTFSGVTSLSLNGCFTSSHTTYVLRGTGTSSADTTLYVRYRAAGTDATGSNYSRGLHFMSTAASSFNQGSASSTFGIWNSIYTTGRWAVDANVYDPFEAVETNSTNISTTSSGLFMGWNRLNTSTSYDGITIYPATGNISGNIAVYGFKE
jgi:hypothetical protein